MTPKLVADFERQFPGGATVRAVLRRPANRFSITVLFGPSGCGKTTILRCLAGLDRPQRGRIDFGETVWLDTAAGICLPPQRRNVGYLSQDYALFPHLSVTQNIAYGLHGLGRGERQRRVAELLALLGLAGLAARYPGQVSGGQQQRIALARALARRPQLLLLDEPLSALDASTREQLRHELRRVLSDFAIPAIIVTHDRVEAIALADHVVVLDQGMIRQSGPVQEVFNRPADLAVARIVGVETVLPARIVRVDDGLATVAVGGAELVAVGVGAKVGEVYLCIRAEEVALQKGAAGHSSARNQLGGVIRSLVPEGPMVRVGLDCGFALAALITRPACTELGLHEGGAVTALVKAPAVHIIPRS
jgi:molybdate transport system ATP-binding protein